MSTVLEISAEAIKIAGLIEAAFNCRGMCITKLFGTGQWRAEKYLNDSLLFGVEWSLYGPLKWGAIYIAKIIDDDDEEICVWNHGKHGWVYNFYKRDSEYRDFIAKGLLHLGFDENEVFQGLEFTFSAHERLEWQLEYEARLEALKGK